MANTRDILGEQTTLDLLITRNITAFEDDSISTISPYAFRACTNLTSVSFPEMNSEVKQYAFYECSNLISVSLPKATRFGDYALYDCIKLENIYAPNAVSIGSNVLYGCKNLASVSFPEVVTISGSAFQGCTSLASVSFPEVSTIGPSAFRECTHLASVSFPKATSFGGSAFKDCTNLASASFPNVRAISGSSFQNCSNLNTLILGYESQVSTLSDLTALQATPIASGTGYVYVPASLVDSYKAANNWSTYANQIKSIESLISESVVSWSTGTDAQIVRMVELADLGLIDLADYWNVGDERTVRLSAMAATGVGESHVEQDVTLVLMNEGGKTLNSPTTSGRTTCSFIVGQKDSLSERGSLNSTSSTNAGGWEACPRRTWCNDVYYNAIPSTLRPIFKKVLNKTANGGINATAAVESVDYFALPAEYEVFGLYNRSNQTYETGLQQFEYYETASNRIKKVGSNNFRWWERSPSGGSNFCRVTEEGTSDSYGPTQQYGLAPFGCI